MLNSAKLVGFIASAQPHVSRRFYTETLGLSLIEESAYAIVVSSADSVLRIQITDRPSPPSYTSIGWQVEDIDETVAALLDAGVQFERYQGMQQDAAGIWTAPGGARVAWFKDPDGNLLSLTQQV